MIECITKDTVLTILASHYAKATPHEENLIMKIYHEVKDVEPVRYLPEYNQQMDKLLKDCGWE